jgi:hypothetical protein
MELIDLLRVVRRWFWLIVAMVVVTELALWLACAPLNRCTPPPSLQMSTPQREEVAAYDEYAPSACAIDHRVHGTSLSCCR